MKLFITLLFGSILFVAAVESVTEIFVGFYDTNGIIRCGPLKDFQPAAPTNFSIIITNR